jgi:Tol biopolymer transport system component
MNVSAERLVGDERLSAVWTLCALGLSVGLCSCAVGCGGGSPAPPVGGTIAYLRTTGVGIGGRLVVMHVDGSHKRVLQGKFVDTPPVWSPDGRRVAFYAVLDKNFEHASIDVVDRQGSNLRVLTPRAWLEDCSWPVWTHDSRTLAFTRNLSCDGDIGIYTVRADGTQLRAFLKADVNRPGASDPAWSPDGHTISYISQRSGLTLVNADGSNTHVLTGSDAAPIIGIPTPPPTAWSPAGSRIYYLDVKAGISAIDRDNTRRHRVVITTSHTKPGEGIHRVIEFALSPNGRLIAFCAGDGRQRNLYIVHTNGSGLRKLADMSADPSWSPGGNWIAFDGIPKGSKRQIWIVNPDGRNLRDVSNDTSADYAPAWAPVTR